MDKCLVLGGNSGIGEAVVNGLGSIGEPYVPMHYEIDVTNKGQMFDYLRDYGPFKYIIYSAGVNKLCWISDLYKDNILWHTCAVNVQGFVDIVSWLKDYWPEWKVSAVAVSSDAGEIPMRGSLAYCVSKAALNMAIKVMARELAPIWRVNGVAPGMVEGTRMTEYIDETIPVFRGWSPEYAREYERASVPTGRRATLEEIAETIRWVLLGPEQMTGEIIKINGGRS